jgi:hypothetical protein
MGEQAIYANVFCHLNLEAKHFTQVLILSTNL